MAAMTKARTEGKGAPAPEAVTVELAGGAAACDAVLEPGHAAVGAAGDEPAATLAPEPTASLSPEEAAQLAAMCERRAGTYALLSRLTRVEVDEPFLAELRAMRFPAHTGSAEVDEGYRLLAGYLSGAQGDVMTELAVDYARTFIGAGMDGRAAAYPYESVYTSEKRLLMQDARDQVLATYRAHGLDKAHDWAEAEDHVALELEFMQLMATRVAEALRAGDEPQAQALLETQASFARDHLENWLPAFVHDVLRFARTDFYRGVAHLLFGFAKEDLAFLDELLG